MKIKQQAWWAHRQGLEATHGDSAEALARTGWSRSVGGSNPYLAIRARTGLGRAAIDADVAALRIHELPSARGCTYVVPAADFGLALRAGAGRGEPGDLVTARKHCGVTDAEIERAVEAVLKALDSPLSPDDLKSAVGDAVRNLGEVGRKKGMTTTLPLVLGLLQGQGRIRRIAVNGRLDQQRYRYIRWDSPPTCTRSLEEVHAELARRFFGWIGPATVDHFCWFSALSKKDGKAAVADLGLVSTDAGLLLPEDVDAWQAFTPPTRPHYVLVGSLDNITHLRRDVAGLLAEPDAARSVWGEKGPTTLGGLSDLNHHAILDRGRLVGLWDYEKAAQKIVWTSFEPASAELKAAVANMEAFVREDLEDARTFSLDSPESRTGRLAALAAR